MKARELIFPRPMKLLQSYSNMYWYTKRVRSYSQRDEVRMWDIRSKHGYVAHGKLYLPENAVEQMNLDTGSLIIMHDSVFAKEKGVFAVDEREHGGYSICVDVTDGDAGSTMFEVKVGDDGALQLHLRDINKLPKRTGFMISNLRLHEAVEVKLNFKDSLPLQGTERYLEDHTYIFEYMGEYDRCYLLREPFDAVAKEVPKRRKEVNLLKEIWM